MKKKYWIITAIFLSICVLLPFGIEWLYIIGETHPLICTHYTASDILGYITTIIGLIISMMALFLSLKANENDIRIKHAITISEQGNEALMIEIGNNNNFDCSISSVELCDQRNRIFSHIISTPPFTIKGKCTETFIVEIERIKEVLKAVGKNAKLRDIKYCIRLSINNSLFLDTKELFEYLKEWEKHSIGAKK